MRNVASTLLIVAGCVLVAYGVGLRWFWAGLVVGGVELVAVGVVLGLPDGALARSDE